MNLFIEDLAGYLIDEWDRSLGVREGDREARFIVQSLDSVGTLALFQALDAHRRDRAGPMNLACYFRVATGLWQAWAAAGPGRVSSGAAASAVAELERQGWIDKEDQLTWYRNRTAQEEGAEGLVVVLVGFNHATDQGGLADFHRVDEKRLIGHLKGSFQPWLQRIAARLSVDPGETELVRFDTVLQGLFELRPLRLAKLAGFLQPLIDQAPCYDFGEFRARVFKALPFWEIPPLLADGQGGVLNGPAAVKILNEADAFISHQRYKTLAGRRKDWIKIDAALAKPGFVLPLRVDGTAEFADLADYRSCIEGFIKRADLETRARLLKVDFMPLQRALDPPAVPGTKKAPPNTIPAFQAMSFQALLQGVWEALLRFADKQCAEHCLWERLAGIQVKLEAFHHDLSGDDGGGIGAKEMAVELLRGCLGGLEQRFAEMELKLPLNAEQAQRPPANWERPVEIVLALDLDALAIVAVKRNARPYVQFRVNIADVDVALPVPPLTFRWYLDDTQPERVRQQCAKRVGLAWKQQGADAHRVLPAFRVNRVDLTALFFAADADEANRLVTKALGRLELVDLMEGLPNQQMDSALRAATKKLIAAYRQWLDATLERGYYSALFKELLTLLGAYDELAGLVLNSGMVGAPELLRRLYKAFLVVDDQALPNDPFLATAVAWGLTPAVLELSLAQTRFLADGFPEAIAELALGDRRSGKAVFERLLDLSRLQRPLTALVTDAKDHLSTDSRSFGLLHCLGKVPDTAKSLAVQTLLKEDESDDDEDVNDIIGPCEEQTVVLKVLNLYQDLHAYARDGLRILAVNVRDLSIILSGVDTFLKQVLKGTTGGAEPRDLPPFYCTVMVYSTSSSPLAMENGLALWRDHIMESHRESGRALDLTVGHRFAPKRQIAELLHRERRLYDLAFLFHFLRTDMDGKLDPALAFTMGADGVGGYFPIAEYPRPIKSGDRTRRQMLLSNRRLRIQTRHSDLSARLRGTGQEATDFVVYGQVDFAPWADVVRDLHAHAQWVVCMDSFVDKRLLDGSAGDTQGLEQGGRRKIVGFESGLGAYGELNLTISTEQDTLEQLTERVAHELTGLLPHQSPVSFPTMAERIVRDAEEIIGLASLRAVLGHGEKLREVVGFAAICRMLNRPHGEMSQLLPLDALQHWFEDADTDHRADLLALTLEVRPDSVEGPLIHATVVECKMAGYSAVTKAQALAQVSKALRHFTRQFAPRGGTAGQRGFDRRYWWAQLHRAIASRALVTLSEQALRQLDHALENLAEGRFKICWRGVIFTFWTNSAIAEQKVTPLTPPDPVTQAPIPTPPGFAIEQVELGYEGLAALFAQAEPEASFSPGGVAICLVPRDLGGHPLGAGHGPAQWDRQVAKTAANAPCVGGMGGEGVTEPPANAPIPAPTPQEWPWAPTPTTPISGPSAVTRVPVPPMPTTDVGTGSGGLKTPVEETAASSPADKAGAHATEPPQDADQVPFTLPERILIGTRPNGEPVYWHYGHPKLQNRHLLIFGTSGSGKTYGIQCLLAEMACTGLRSLIVDYTDGFLPTQVERRFTQVANPKDHFVYTERLPLNPFRRQRQVIDPAKPAVEEGSFQVASRIESIFAAVFDMGDQQSAALIRSLQSGLDLDPGFSLDKLLPRLREDSPQGESLANKLEPLIQAKPFREGVESAWDGMLTSASNRVHVLQLRGLAREIQKLVTEFVLWDLWDYAQSTGGEGRPIPIVLDEIQNLDHSSDSPLDKMLREGRKFGVSLLLATQTTSQFNAEQRDRLFQAGHKLFFKPATTEIDRFAQILTQATSGISKAEWTQRLAKLEKGYCWSLGPVLRPDGTFMEEAVLVSVTALEQRRFEG